MKWRLAIISLFCCLASVSQAQLLCKVDNKNFVAGETVHYQLYYNLGFVWIPAGTCEFKVRNAYWDKKPVYQLMLSGRTQKSFDSFFKVRDTLVSYVHRDHIVPYKAFKYTHEDRWEGIDEFTYRQDSNGFRITTRLKRKHLWKEPVESRTNMCGFDMVTSMYRLRCLSDERLYVKGKRSEIPVRLDDDEYNIYITYLGKQRVKLYGGGYYTAHAFALSMIEGQVFKRGDVLKMWVSDDGNKIPLLVESPIRVGNVKAIFRGAENTLNPIAKPSAK